jgi:hypothetical protein
MLTTGTGSTHLRKLGFEFNSAEQMELAFQGRLPCAFLFPDLQIRQLRHLELRIKQITGAPERYPHSAREWQPYQILF